MDKIWFKLLTIILIFYTFIAGMMRPLNPGIMEVDPFNIKTDTTVTLKVHSYNTHLSEVQNVAFLSIDSVHSIKATSFKVIANNESEITFRIPRNLPYKEPIQDASLIITNNIDGGFIRPAALTLTQSGIDLASGQIEWSKDQLNTLPESTIKGFPFRLILEETIRNLYYHVPFWMAMFILFTASVFYAIRSLVSKRPDDRIKVYAFNRVGFFFGIMGLITGAIWARFAWGQYWSGDIKQNMTAIALLIYAAYFILWKSFKDETVQARVSNVFTIFAYVTMIPLIFVIPRLYDSLHPGNGGNPALGGEDLDSTMRMVFYPGVIAFTLLGFWLSNIYFRIRRVEHSLKQ